MSLWCQVCFGFWNGWSIGLSKVPCCGELTAHFMSDTKRGIWKLAAWKHRWSVAAWKLAASFKAQVWTRLLMKIITLWLAAEPLSSSSQVISGRRAALLLGHARTCPHTWLCALWQSTSIHAVAGMSGCRPWESTLAQTTLAGLERGLRQILRAERSAFRLPRLWVPSQCREGLDGLGATWRYKGSGKRGVQKWSKYIQYYIPYSYKMLQEWPTPVAIQNSNLAVNEGSGSDQWLAMAGDGELWARLCGSPLPPQQRGKNGALCHQILKDSSIIFHRYIRSSSQYRYVMMCDYYIY